MANRFGTYADRAKQFMPFDALKGFREALREREKVLVPRAELSEERRDELDAVLRTLAPGDMVRAVYYRDGEYVRLTGLLAGVDPVLRAITVVDTVIGAENLWDLERVGE